MESEIAVGYFCGRCQRHWSTFLRAESCCAPVCADCGAEFGAAAVRYTGDDGQGRCWACWRVREEQKAAERYTQAVSVLADKLPGPVYWENRDRFYSNPAEAFTAIQDQVLGGEIERIQVRVYSCIVKPCQLTVDGVLGRALEGHAAGSEWDQEAQLVMQSFLELWNQRYAHQVVSWFPDFSRKIVFPDVWWASIPVVEEV